MIALPLAGVPRLSVVIPVHNGGRSLVAVLDALASSDLPRTEWELIVIDDASEDASVGAAARVADVVVRLPERARGPAYARNRGVELARAPIVAFIDADVVVRPETLRLLVQRLDDEPGTAAVFAVNDGGAPVRGVLSQYWNLLHHVAALRHGDPSSATGAACWAVRRDALAAVGMFDEWRFHGPLGEDLELSHRLRAGGYRVRRERRITVTHLKRWTIGSVARDVWGRGVLLSRLLGPRAAIQVARGDVLSVLANPWMGGAVAAAVGGAAVLRATGASGATAVGAAVAAFVVMHFFVFSLYALRRGLLFTGIVVPMHLLIQLVAMVAVVYGWMLRNVIGDPNPDVKIQAYAEVGAQMWPPVPQRR